MTKCTCIDCMYGGNVGIEHGGTNLPSSEKGDNEMSEVNPRDFMMIPHEIDLKAGEYRWFKSCWRENLWQVGMVCTICSGLDFNHYAFCVFSGDYVDEADVIEIGPVIHPPETL